MKLKLREPVNGLTHLIGALLSIAGLVLLIIYAVKYGSALHIVSFVIYGVSLFLMYLSSTLYHLLPLSEPGIRQLKRIDHMMIFLLIAGSYTPFCLIALKGAWGWSIFGLIWGLALSGIIFKIFWIHAPRWLSSVIYVLMGWVAIVAIVPLIRSVPNAALFWLVNGGLLYTIGAIIYGFKWPNFHRIYLGFHEIWHLFVIAASLCHFWAIFRYVTFISV